MAIHRYTLTRAILIIALIIGFICINYTIPIFPALMRLAFPFNTIILWGSFILFYFAGINIQKAKISPAYKYYIPVILLIIAIKVTIPLSILPIPPTSNIHWQKVFNNSFHWVWKSIIPIFIYFIWLYSYKKSPIKKITPQQIWLIIFCGILFIPILLYVKKFPSFQYSYPKLNNIHSLKLLPDYWQYAIGFEAMYLIDFITIEILFRGLLVQVFLKEKNARSYIIPMSLVYGIIHYAKPLLECVSSFVGGGMLGYLTYKTNEINIGIFIHLYIAIMMEWVMIF